VFVLLLIEKHQSLYLLVGGFSLLESFSQFTFQVDDLFMPGCAEEHHDRNEKTTVDGRKPAPVEVGSLSHYLQGFVNRRSCRISSIYIFFKQSIVPGCESIFDLSLLKIVGNLCFSTQRSIRNPDLM